MKKKIFCIITVILIISAFAINTFANEVIQETSNNTYSISYLKPQAEIGMYISLGNAENWYIGETITFPTGDGLFYGYLQGDIRNHRVRGSEDITADIHIDNWKGVNEVINSDITKYSYETSIGIYRAYDENYNEISHQKTGSQLILRNFYVWNESALNNDGDTILSEISIANTSTYIRSVTYKYRELWSTEIKTTTVTPNVYNNWSPSINDLTERNENSQMMYIEEALIELANPSTTTATINVYDNKELLSYVLSHSSMNTVDPAINLRPIGLALATAVGGFLDFEILPGFSLGGILMVTLAFLCVIWWLKLVAGG